MGIRVIFAIGIVYIATAFVVAQAVVLPKTAELAPSETIVLVDISDFNHLRARFEKSFVYKLYKDPTMAAFVADFTGKWREKMQGDKNPVIKAVLDANRLPEGRVAIAMALAGARGEPAFVLIGQWGRNAGGLKEAIEKAAVSSDRAIEDYCDVNLVTLTTAPLEKTTYCFIDDCLVAGTDVDTVKFAIARIKGVFGGSALAADNDYVAAIGAVGPYHDVDLYVNLKQLLKKMAGDRKSVV